MKGRRQCLRRVLHGRLLVPLAALFALGGLLIPSLLEAQKQAPKKSLSISRPMELLELQLRTHRLEELESFYGEVLELPVLESGDSFFVLKVGTSRLRFEAAAPGQEPAYHFGLEIPENKVALAVRWLGERHELLQGEGEEPFVRVPQLNAHSVYFSDPAGNFVELVGRHDLPTATPGVFSPEDFLKISEVGLVVNKFPRVAVLLLQRLGLKRIPGPRSQRYGVFGDGSFNFVVVEKGLTWSRTEQAAMPYPLVAIMRGERGSLLISDMPFVLRLQE